MPKLPKTCPSCQSNLEVTRLTCPRCGTEVSGRYQPDFFSRLSPNDFDFVVLFIKTKGNIKEMERELGISYWTIRSKLNEVVEELVHAEEADQAESAAREGEEMAAQRQRILEQLNAGMISVDEAAARLEELKNRR